MAIALNAAQKVIDEYKQVEIPNWQRVAAINWEISLFKRFGDYQALSYTEAPDGRGRIVIGFPQLITRKHYPELEKVAKSYNLEMEVKKPGAVVLKDKEKDLAVAYLGYNVITILPPDKYEKAGELLEDIGNIVGASTERKVEGLIYP